MRGGISLGGGGGGKLGGGGGGREVGGLSSIWYTATCLVSRAIGGPIRFVVYQLTV